MEEESKVLDNYKVIEDCLCIRMPEEVDHHRSEEICKMRIIHPGIPGGQCGI